MNNELLPPNASLAEIALAGAAAGAIRDIGVPNRGLYSAGLCPAPLLPWLAWAFSVDGWDDGWTEAQKRGAIANSVYIHRHKGTVGAMKRALLALGYDIDLIEWQQMTPHGDPYTFGLVVDVGDVGMPDSQSFDRIIDVAESAKNVRSHMTFVDLKATRSGALYGGGVAFMGETISITYGGPLLLDGSWSLNGTYKLNGTKS